MERMKKIKKGAASFYIVVFSTLILLVVVVSFAAVVSMEMTKSSNDDLSQSAYDSAMAGIEDAKLAYDKYIKCKGGASLGDCANIIGLVESDGAEYVLSGSSGEKISRCDMVEYILEGSVSSSSIVGDGSMQQEYTCVQISTIMKDIKKTVTSDEPVVIRPKFSDSGAAGSVEKIKIEWGSAGSDYRATSGSNFPQVAPEPPVISLALVQTAESFNLSQFDGTVGDGNNGRTNRGMLYLVPDSNGGNGPIGKEAGFLNSNDRTKQNTPYGVKCNEKSDSYYCGVEIEIPKPVDGNRKEDTFAFIVSLPYGGQKTDFSMKFFDDKNNQLNLKGQVNIDSTGRANDLYRRLSVRLESEDESSLIFNPFELVKEADGSGNSGKLTKNMVVTTEHGNSAKK